MKVSEKKKKTFNPFKYFAEDSMNHCRLSYHRLFRRTRRRIRRTYLLVGHKSITCNHVLFLSQFVLQKYIIDTYLSKFFDFKSKTKQLGCPEIWIKNIHEKDMNIHHIKSEIFNIHHIFTIVDTCMYE